MNLLLLEEDELDASGHARLSGRRAEHLCRVLGVEPGDHVRAGILGVGKGRAEVLAVGQAASGRGLGVELRLDLPFPPSAPATLALELVVALPRPQALKRVLEAAATFGVSRLDLIRAWRVEKSYFHTPVLEPERLRRHLLLGAEQGMHVALPEVGLHRRFVPFVETLGERQRKPLSLIAHPTAAAPIEGLAAEIAAAAAVEIAIGPEGGWIDREMDSFIGAGFHPVRLGPWVLRVETALVAALAQIDLLRRTPRAAMS